ncbi:MAG: CPBP family intramembrane glutamic endopeptidase [Promethearchaeota archaeon]
MNLGENPWILIGFMFLELLFIIIPVKISAIVEKKRFSDVLKEIGFKHEDEHYLKKFLKIFTGISLGVFFYFIGGYIIFFFRNIIVENIFGTAFIKTGEKGAIKALPVKLNIIQLIIIIILEFLLVAICEEAFFRGFLLTKLANKIKKYYATIISSIFFAIYHVPPFLVPIATIITFFGYFFSFGILLSLIFYLFKGSLIPCILAHGFFNVLIIIL